MSLTLSNFDTKPLHKFKDAPTALSQELRCRTWPGADFAVAIGGIEILLVVGEKDIAAALACHRRFLIELRAPNTRDKSQSARGVMRQARFYKSGVPLCGRPEQAAPVAASWQCGVKVLQTALHVEQREWSPERERRRAVRILLSCGAATCQWQSAPPQGGGPGRGSTLAPRLR